MIANLQKKLSAIQEQPSQQKALIGFDGYIDLIQKVVKSSTNSSKEYYSCLREMGLHISSAADKSAQLEICTLTRKAGGNAPIMANALAHLGIRNYCVGTMGYPGIQDCFLQMHENCTLVSVGEPGTTNALEFDNGKLMLSETSTFDSLDLNYILNLKGSSSVSDYLHDSSLVAMVDWANLPLCTQLWKQMHQFISDAGLLNRTYFFDLCDPSKKTKAEIEEALQLIGSYKELGRVILGLNENEAVKIYNAIHSSSVLPGNSVQLNDMVQNIYQSVDVDILLVHPNDRSLIATKNGIATFAGHIVKDPKVLTGGGDNLNAGFCFGLLNSFSIEECALIGMATSGAYVKNGRSPGIPDLIAYLNNF